MLSLKKNDEIEITIDALTSEGSGVGRYEGMAVFVRGTVPGDRIIAHIIKTSKKYAVGIIDKIITPSPSRIESDCPYSQKCGGCSFRNMTYGEELKYKKSRVRDAVQRIGHIDIDVEEIIGTDDLNCYRNKAQYPVQICDGELFAGFYAYKSHRIIPCTNCLLQPVEFENGLEAFRIWTEKANITSFDENTGKGLLRHIYFRKGYATGEIMACAVINGDSIPQAQLLVSLLREKVLGLKSVVLNINKKNTNVILGDKTVTLWGSDTISDILLGKRFIISPNSFYQVNHNQCEKLYSKAAEFADLTGSETVLDLYCGVGTIGLTMADKVKSLIGIEIVPQAIENAKENAKINGVENAEFICANAPDGAKILQKKGIAPDVIILDPPRKGCDASLFDTIEMLSPEKIVYVSCDSATLARDLSVLKEKGYKTERLTAVDLFPRTPHVEAVALLCKAEK
ncbi:MAG: 23S rRNA (uracil(1939)-C(5))-methyltransferase RlmD [Eubacteriales bacterium]|nr:23S rRNA (uracil(1939)-C(5))-methyltransferase RlmD [Eubacteriales bacterium]